MVTLDYSRYTCGVESMFDLHSVVDLQQVVATELDVRHRDAVLEEIYRVLRRSAGIGFCDHLHLHIYIIYRY